MFVQKSRLAVSGFVLAVVLGAGQAQAADAKQVADAIVALVAAGGKATATYDNASASGDDVTITNLKVTGEGNDLTVPSVVITGAQSSSRGNSRRRSPSTWPLRQVTPTAGGPSASQSRQWATRAGSGVR